MSIKWAVTAGTNEYDTNNIELSISDTTIAKLFDKAFDGWCPICRDAPINKGEIVCCGCLKLIMDYHSYTCGCIA